MKRNLLIALVAVMSISSWAADGNEFGKMIKKSSDAKEVGIQFFSGTWQEALAEAKEEKKIIFLDAYASWCGPCKLMSANTFTDASVGEFFNKNFISYKMDMEKHADGPRLSRKYALRSYPTLYFINGDENLVHQAIGYMKPEELIAVGEIALDK